MEHPCHKCGAAVPEGTPFCPQCGAPQIRVRTEVDPSTLPTATDLPVAVLRVPDRTRLLWRAVFPKATLGGLAMAVLVMLAGIPALLVFIPPVCAAAAAVWYSRREKTELTAGMGARIGAVTGFFGFVFQSLILAAVFLSKPGEMKAGIHKQIEEAVARNPNPQAHAMGQNLLTPEGIVAVAVLGLAVFFVFYLILGSLGGAIGSSFTRKKPT